MPPSHAPAEWSGEFLMSSSTVDDLSCTLTPEEQSRHLAQQEATGRKSWKTMKDKGEAVWSPTVEAALLEGLTSYVRPPESPVRRRTSLSKKPSSNRFPYRNRFISGWILRQTGKYRTPKQVGSRLQQLRDTCRREDIRALIVPPSDGDDSGDDSSTSPTSSSTFLPSSSPSSYKKESPGIDSPLQGPHLQPQSSTSSLVNIIVTLILDPDASSVMVRAPVTLAGYHDSEPLSTNVYLAPLRTGNGLPSLSSFNSSISFWSPIFPVMVETTFTVYKHTLSQPIGTETARMYTLPTPTGRDGWSYCTDLCPKFWKLISNDPDVGQYIIVQTVTPQSTRPTRPVKISYRFVQPSSASSSALANDPMPTTLHYDYSEHQEWQPAPPLLPISNVSYTLATALGQHTIPTSLMESKRSASSTNNHLITVTAHPSLTAGVPSTLLTSEYVSHYEASYAIDPLQYRTYQKNI